MLSFPVYVLQSLFKSVDFCTCICVCSVCLFRQCVCVCVCIYIFYTFLWFIIRFYCVFAFVSFKVYSGTGPLRKGRREKARCCCCLYFLCVRKIENADVDDDDHDGRGGGGGGVSEFGSKIYYLVFTMFFLCLFLSGFRRHVCRLITMLCFDAGTGSLSLFLFSSESHNDPVLSISFYLQSERARVYVLFGVLFWLLAKITRYLRRC